MIRASLSLSVMGGEHLTIATVIVQKAKSECASFEDGKFNMTEQTITLPVSATWAR